MNGNRIVLASGNVGKLQEIQTLLKPMNAELVLQKQLNIESIEEAGLTFVENAILKARHAAHLSKCPALADDSGLVVDALSGQPGIYSARFAGNRASDAQNNQKLLSKLKSYSQIEQRSAHFICVLVFMRHAEDPEPIIAEGKWYGNIAHQPSGENGFGYDPLFWLQDKKCTAAELSKEEKNKRSHRGKAMQYLRLALEAEYKKN